MTLTDNKKATICLRKAKVIKSEIKELSQANQTMRFKGKGMPKILAIISLSQNRGLTLL